MEQEIDLACLHEVSEIELVYKSKAKPSKRPKIGKSKDAYGVFIKYWDKNKIELMEQFNVMFLNRNNRVLAICQMATGGMTGTVVDPRLLFVAALKVGANSAIVAHNHPSNNFCPSQADIELTKKLKYGGELLDIKLLDHLIVTASEGYYSMADEGQI